MTLKFAAAAASAALLIGATSFGASADSISSVENARAKDRAGDRLTRQDRDQLRKYGRSSDNYGPRYYRDGGYYDSPGVSVYVGPRRYYDRYGY